MLRDGTVRVTVAYGGARHEAHVDAALCSAQVAGACGLADGARVKVILKGRVLAEGESVPDRARLLVVRSEGEAVQEAEILNRWVPDTADPVRGRLVCPALRRYLPEGAFHFLNSLFGAASATANTATRAVLRLSAAGGPPGPCTAARGSAVALEVDFGTEGDEAQIEVVWDCVGCGVIEGERTARFSGAGPWKARQTLAANGLGGFVTCTISEWTGRQLTPSTAVKTFEFAEHPDAAYGTL